jgi:hypothetical protein
MERGRELGVKKARGPSTSYILVVEEVSSFARILDLLKIVVDRA